MQTFLSQSLPMTIKELEAEIEQIDAWRLLCSNLIKDFMAKEDVEKKIFYAKEIHELIQERNMLETHREFRRVRIARLKYDEQGR